MPNVCVVLGAQWGDEGKGKLVDLLSKEVDVVCRCQGGNNAGHTVINGDKQYFFHLLPSGLVNHQAIGVIGNGVVVDLNGLFKEIDNAFDKGLTDIESRLRISDRCHLVFELHQEIDRLEEEIRGTGLIGTTKKGIGPTYSSKITRNGLRICDLMGDWKLFSNKFTNLVDYAKRRYGKLDMDVEKCLNVLYAQRQRLESMVVDTVSLINKLVSHSTQRVLVEGAQSSMLDIDFGTYPFVTSSNCSIGGVCTGLGLPPSKVGEVYGVVKAYTTRVGSGPFPTELINSVGSQIQEIGREWGVTTKRKRRVGWLDAVVIRYAHMVNDFTALALTKLDVLDGLDEVKIGHTYMNELTKAEVPIFPADIHLLDHVTVVYETLPGWTESTQSCKSFSDLPLAARNYVEAIERHCGVPIRWIGTGPSRDAMICHNSVAI